MQKVRIFWKIYATYLFVTVCCLLFLSWITTISFREFYLIHIKTSLETQALLISRHLGTDLEKINDLSGRINALNPSSKSRITIIKTDGTVAADTDKNPAQMDNHKDRKEILEAVSGKQGHSMRFSNTLKTDMMYVAIPVSNRDTTKFILRFSVPVPSLKTELKKVNRNIFSGGIIIAFIIMIVSLFFSRGISIPLQKMREGAEKIAGGDFSVKLASGGSVELGSLSDALNRMAEELKQKLETIQRQQSEKDAVFRSMQEAVIAVDNNRSILLLNPYAADLFEIDNKAATGKNILNLIRNTKLHDCLSRFLAGEELLEETFNFEKGSNQRVLQARGTTLRNNKNEIIGALVVMNDITRLKKLESMRRDFVANVSHELKTPIAAIKGAAETLEDGALDHPGDARKFVKMIAANGERLNRIVEDLLNLSKIEQCGENEKPEPGRFKLKGIINEAVNACEMRSAEKSVRIEKNVPEDLLIPVEPQLIEQAFINLIDNAIKYSNEGAKINITAEEKETEIHISVSDNGPGIPEVHLPRIFERFYRVDKARSRNLGGTGLGLAIVKHIAQTHGGKVTVESKLGEGSCFTIVLPKLEQKP